VVRADDKLHDQNGGALPPLAQGVAKVGAKPSAEDASQPGRHKFHKFGLHEFKTVWDIHADESFSLEIRSQLAFQTRQLGLLHDRDYIGPSQLLRANALIRISAQSGEVGRVPKAVGDNGRCRWASFAGLSANEQDIGHEQTINQEPATVQRQGFSVVVASRFEINTLGSPPSCSRGLLSGECRRSPGCRQSPDVGLSPSSANMSDISF
jgi:hypothetical protein